MSQWSRDLDYDYEELRREDADPSVWKPEDGHEFVKGQTPSTEHLCRKCGRIWAWHINQRSTA